MPRKNQTAMMVLLVVLVVCGCICWWRYTRGAPEPQEKEGFHAAGSGHGVDLIDSDPREMDIEDLEHETDLMSFGVGPGIADSRRHHTWA